MHDGWLHHIDITVTDLARSTQFYSAVLPLVGFRRVADSFGSPVWWGARCELALIPTRPGSKRDHDRYSPGLHHLAFGAPSRSAVDDVYIRLQSLGVEILDPPAEYPEYSPGYYAVFFGDPDGIKLEYVFTSPERE
jgi:catechol 2,3-dioxygenase-like lactoylglutathione lyase family enzyme